MPAGPPEQDQSIDSSGEYQEPGGAAGPTRRRTQAPARQAQGSRGKGGRPGGSQASHHLCSVHPLGLPAQQGLPGIALPAGLTRDATAGLPGVPARLQTVTLTPGAGRSTALSSCQVGCAVSAQLSTHPTVVSHASSSCDPTDCSVCRRAQGCAALRQVGPAQVAEGLRQQG